MDDSSAFTGRIKVRYRDTDALGHLYFANYLVFADEMTADYMEELGYSTNDLNEARLLIFTVNINCDYLGECKYGDTVRAVIRYERLGKSSAVLGFSLCNDSTDELLARGQITQVYVDRGTRKSCGLPSRLRDAITERHPDFAKFQ